jgi:hypothetical protein
MYTMRTPSCDSEAEARAEAKADHLANLDPRDHDPQEDPEFESPWDTRCPECGRMDHDLMYTVSRHVPGCEHAAEMLRMKEEEDAEAKEHHDYLVQMCIDDPTLEIHYGRLRKKAV